MELIEASSYAVNGEDNERLHGHLLAELFPNSEKFWKQFIVPLTNRIDQTITNPQNSIHPREGTSNELHDIGSFHYSIFYNFLLADLAIKTRHPSYFESFYTHLGSICDSAEEFLMEIFFLNLECTNTQSEVLEKLSKESFITLAEEWYDSNYENVYEHYLSKGKPPPMKLPMRASVLEEYCVNSQAWKDYRRFSQKIREYRNVIVHNYQIASVLFPNGVSYVPKKEKIKNYKRWNDVFSGAANPQIFERDFVNREEQMIQDIHEMMVVLNNVWDKPIADMSNLFFTEKNHILLQKYNLELTQ